jgi:hypothetical protein
MSLLVNNPSLVTSWCLGGSTVYLHETLPGNGCEIARTWIGI